MMASIERMWQKMIHSIGIGRIKVVDDSGSIQQIQVLFPPNRTVDQVLHPQDFGFASNPPINSEVFAVSMMGDPSKCFAVAANKQTLRPRNMLTGEVIIYDAFGRSVRFDTSGGIIVDANNTAVTVNRATTVVVNAATEIDLDAPLVKVSGNLLVAGDITDENGSNTKTLKSLRDAYNAHTHVVTSIQTGTSSRTTNTPLPQDV